MSAAMPGRVVVVAVAAILAGCTPGENQKETVRQQVTIDLDAQASTQVLDKETGASISIDDSCQMYMDASPGSEELYDIAACTYIAVLMGVAPSDKRPGLPDHPRCRFEEPPKIPAGMKSSMGTFCEKKPKGKVRDALDHYWDQSLEKGAFN